MTKGRGRWSLAPWIVGCVVSAFVVRYVYNAWGDMGPFFRADAMSTLGKSEAEARRIMKVAPRFVLTPAEVKADGIDAPWRWMNFQPVPTRSIQKRVLLYQHYWLAAYIFIDAKGNVEAVEMAGT